MRCAKSESEPLTTELDVVRRVLDRFRGTGVLLHNTTFRGCYAYAFAGRPETLHRLSWPRMLRIAEGKEGIPSAK